MYFRELKRGSIAVIQTGASETIIYKTFHLS